MVGESPLAEILIPTLDWNTPLKLRTLRFALFYDGGFLRNEDFKFTLETTNRGGTIIGGSGYELW